ncbi:MAG: prepilin-type N-terminal cleavage/methylation domain-containing protein [Deltaproteobacteria bacterium]|nr:prepilin-type N-terminal cleavage/methylation domain-containing protein [Deltaproteobacteria bacterium]
MKLIRNQKGFTLVELAIVLVIIGLILGAVLKGQALIANAKVKRTYSMEREIVAAVNTYLDKYSKYPGDDNAVSTRWAGLTDGNNDGLISVMSTTCAAATATETCLAWREMRLANLLTGDTTSAVNPGNPFGGVVGIGTVAALPANTQWIGFTNIPFDVCQQIDLQYDDGSSATGYNTGSIRGSGNYSTATTGTFTLYFQF